MKKAMIPAAVLALILAGCGGNRGEDTTIIVTPVVQTENTDTSLPEELPGEIFTEGEDDEVVDVVEPGAAPAMMEETEMAGEPSHTYCTESGGYINYVMTPDNDSIAMCVDGENEIPADTYMQYGMGSA